MMEFTGTRDVIRRCDCNPLIALDDLPFRAGDIWNAGVVRFGGQVLLLLTIENLEGTYSIHRAVSDDGRKFTVDVEPWMVGADTHPYAMYESFGVRDPRIVAVDGRYFVTYTAESECGYRVGLAWTRDFESLMRMEYLTQVDVKNGAMFPRKIDGRYVLLKRPREGASIWLSRSDDLAYWGDEQVAMTPRGGHWDPDRVGPGPPPIEIEQGWLLLYYGEKGTSAGPLVRMGAAILDRDDPSRVIARSDIPILSPRERYERIGDLPNVIFACGALLEGDELWIYYGASDSCICLGTAPVADVVNYCLEKSAF